ncbi:preprotein translocase subunit SecE [Roseomonas gilardii subsp. gilardii]|uniref:preprotein translocase subunit SecE n=1 Tax=Roseomonas gilardii TaxID=257708 RepID=UPI001FFB0788|nr:preprotein translocase subunit SecE [Roseomonas gilardii]UPG74284.1 preprotein translocase subunit SecE [Roseomonas gilardii subsp. gilardii]
MAEARQHIDMVPVRAEDILSERQAGWQAFTRAASWGIGAIVVILLLLYLFLG